MSAKFESRDIVVPGDLLFEGRARSGDNTYRHEGNIYASRVGLASYSKDRVSVIALEAGFIPLVGDLVIGIVTDIELGNWKVEIGAEKEAILTINDAIGKPFRRHLS